MKITLQNRGQENEYIRFSKYRFDCRVDLHDDSLLDTVLFLLYKKIYMPKIVNKLEEHSRMVHRLSGIGITHEQICDIVGISKPTLYKYYNEELRLGKAEATEMVASNLFKVACGKDKNSLTAMIFWLKTQAKWKETDVLEVTNTTEQNDKFRKLVSDIRGFKLSAEDSNESNSGLDQQGKTQADNI